MAWERKLMRTVRVQNDQVVGTLAHLITAIAEQGSNVGEINLIKEGHRSVVREITVYAEDNAQLERITHEMYLAAAQTIADMTPSGELVPSPLDKNSPGGGARGSRKGRRAGSGTRRVRAISGLVDWLSGIYRGAPPAEGRIANPTYVAPPDMGVYHGVSQ